MHDTGGTDFSTHFWPNYIDRVSPRTHDSKIEQTRALATCAMADPRTLYGMCSKADPCTARDTLLSYRAGHDWTHLTVCAWVRHYIVPSVHAGGRGYSPRTMASDAAIGLRGAHGAGAVTGAGRNTAWGFLQGDL